MMMIMGDAEVPVVQENPQLQNNRIMNSLKHLKSNETLLLRRRAAELFSNAVIFATDTNEYIQNKIVEGVHNIMKKCDEDMVIMIQILSLLKNLAENRSYLVHLLLSVDIAKLIAYHARNSSFHAIRDLAIQVLGYFAACCQECQRSVAKTTATVTILELLENLETLTFNQKNVYSYALKNIFHHQAVHSDVCVLSIKSKDYMMDILTKLVSLPPHNGAIFNGLAVLHEWMDIGGIDVCDTVTNDEVLMKRLLRMFEDDEDDDEIVGYVIRIVGDLAYSHDLIAKKIYDFGFLGIIETKLLDPEGTPYEQEMLRCLSNILGMREFPIAQEFYKHEELWEKLVQLCYSYDTFIRREAIFCVINVTSVFKGDTKNEIYHEFFGRLLIDTLEGFTEEDDLSMFRVLGPLFCHINDNLKQRCHQYRDLIFEYALEKAVETRCNWIQHALKNFDLTPNGIKELHKLLNICRETINLIEEFKSLPLPTPPTVPLYKFVSSLPACSVESSEFNDPKVPLNMNDVGAIRNNMDNLSSVIDPLDLD